jgi:hypothetical protein
MAPEVQLSASSIRQGEPLTCKVTGLPIALSGAQLNVIVRAIDDVETTWAATLGATVSTDGSATAQWEPSLAGDVVLEVVQLQIVRDEKPSVEWNAGEHFAIQRAHVGDKKLASNDNDLESLAAELKKRQVARYEVSLGNSGAPSAIEHRVLCVVERLQMRTKLRLPGVEILPLTAAAEGLDELQLLKRLLAELGWPSQHVNTEWWRQTASSQRPWTAFLMGSIWATDHNAAAQIAWQERNRLVDLLALNRGASGRPLATAVEQRRGDEVGPWRVYAEQPGYGGNLLGGAISGESQRGLLVQDAGVRSDPLLALCASLYREGRAERSADFAYFRWWSLLETLSGARLKAGAPVDRLDGSRWPGRYNTTSYAAPRVYAFVAKALAGFDETSLVAPAANLYDAVRAWYARRNATGHYGGFVPQDPRQRSQRWYAAALETTKNQGGMAPEGEASLDSLQRTVELVLQGELHRAGNAALEANT